MTDLNQLIIKFDFEKNLKMMISMYLKVIRMLLTSQIVFLNGKKIFKYFRR